MTGRRWRKADMADTTCRVTGRSSSAAPGRTPSRGDETNVKPPRLADHLDLGKSGWDKLVADAISFNSDLLESGVSRRSSEVSVSCRTLTPGKAALALFEEMVPRRQ